MTRAECWGKKILLLDPILDTEARQELMGEVTLEVVSKEKIAGGITILKFADGSLLREMPFDGDPQKRWVDWTED